MAKKVMRITLFLTVLAMLAMLALPVFAGGMSASAATAQPAAVAYDSGTTFKLVPGCSINGRTPLSECKPGAVLNVGWNS